MEQTHLRLKLYTCDVSCLCNLGFGPTRIPCASNNCVSGSSFRARLFLERLARSVGASPKCGRPVSKQNRHKCRIFLFILVSLYIPCAVAVVPSLVPPQKCRPNGNSPFNEPVTHWMESPHDQAGLDGGDVPSLRRLQCCMVTIEWGTIPYVHKETLGWVQNQRSLQTKSSLFLCVSNRSVSLGASYGPRYSNTIALIRTLQNGSDGNRICIPRYSPNVPLSNHFPWRRPPQGTVPNLSYYVPSSLTRCRGKGL